MKKIKTLVLAIVVFPAVLFSQIPTRVITNKGFETPVMGCGGSNYTFTNQSNVNGWKTEDSIPAPIVTCGTSGANKPNLIELWSNGFLGRSSYLGNQIAEINASRATFLYQEICLLANESVPFSVWHLRRAASGTGEEMVAELKQSGTSTISTTTSHIATGTWTNYSGTLTNNASSGKRRYGFRAVSGGSLGNLIDEVTISLKPLVDIKNFSATTIYETDSNYLNIIVNGTLLGSATITISRTGTATYLSDYTIGMPSRGTSTVNSNGDITLTLPAGDYNPNQSSGATAGLISFKYKILDEGVLESNESVIYTITSTANGGNGNAAFDISSNINGQSALCLSAVSTANFVIVDAVALPVTLIDFKAEKEPGFNTVSWMVAEEDNVRNYTLEYSHNGVDFAVLADIYYDPNAFSNYVYVHAPGENVTSYYRLKVTDNSGNTTILSAIAGTSKNINSTFEVYPNPNKGVFNATFYSPKEMKVDFDIVDQFGKQVTSYTTLARKGDNDIIIIPDQALESGVYVLRLKYAGAVKTLMLNVIK